MLPVFSLLVVEPTPFSRGLFTSYVQTDSGDPAKPRSYHMFRFKTQVDSWAPLDVPDEAVRAGLARKKKKLCIERGCHYCDPRHSANISHIACLELAKLRLPRLSVRLLCDLACLMRPVVAWRHALTLMARGGQRSLLQLLKCDISSSTDSGSTVRDVREKLPAELQRLICDMVPPGIFSSLAACSGTLAWIESHGLVSEESRVGRLSFSTETPFKDVSSLRTLRADVFDILGERCLTRITADPEAVRDHQIMLVERPVLGVQYALGLYGVVALRIHYQDGSVSSWLGRRPSRWMKLIRGQDLQELIVRSDVSTYQLSYRKAAPLLHHHLLTCRFRVIKYTR